MKLASIFFTASAENLRGLPQRYKQTSEIHKVYFNVFYSECRLCSRFTAKIAIISDFISVFSFVKHESYIEGNVIFIAKMMG